MVINLVYLIRCPVEILEPDFYSSLFWIGICSCSLWREWFLRRRFSYYLQGGASCPVSSVILLFDSKRSILGDLHLGWFLERDFGVLLESTVLRPINCQQVKIRLSFSNQDLAGLHIFLDVFVEVDRAGMISGCYCCFCCYCCCFVGGARKY